MIGALVAVIGFCYVAELFIAPIDWAAGRLGQRDAEAGRRAALTLAVGIIGATVMPHAIYLHSALIQGRPTPQDDRERAMLIRFSNREVLIALAGAGLVNMAMVAMAASAFHAGHRDVAEIETAYHTLTPLLGAGGGGSVPDRVARLGPLQLGGRNDGGSGHHAGLRRARAIPLWLRRLVTIVPAFAVVAWGVNTTNALVLSQVVLSFALPLPMIALILFTFRRDIMGRFANGFVLHCAAISATVVIVALNVLLLLQTFGAPIPLGAF